jgi:hypothetical protein
MKEGGKGKCGGGDVLHHPESVKGQNCQVAVQEQRGVGNALVRKS